MKACSNTGASRRKPRVAVVGQFQLGKSTLVNCLLDGRYAKTGDWRATTRVLTRYSYGEHDEVTVVRKNGKQETFATREILWNGEVTFAEGDSVFVKCWKPILQHVDLIDTPGFNANETDTATALRGTAQADLLLVVLPPSGVSKANQSLLNDIQSSGKPYAVIMNCTDPDHNADPDSERNLLLSNEINAGMDNEGLSPIKSADHDAVWRCNLLWAWHAMGHPIIDKLDFRHDRNHRDITSFFSDESDKHPTPGELMERSRFQPLRAMLESYPWDNHNALEKEGRSLLKLAESSWSDALKAAANISKWKGGIRA